MCALTVTETNHSSHVSHVRGRKDEGLDKAETGDGMKRGIIAARGSVTGRSALYETGGHPSVVFLLYRSACRENRRCARARETRKLLFVPVISHQQALHRHYRNNELNGCTASAIA